MLGSYNLMTVLTLPSSFKIWVLEGRSSLFTVPSVPVRNVTYIVGLGVSPNPTVPVDEQNQSTYGSDSGQRLECLHSVQNSIALREIGYISLRRLFVHFVGGHAIHATIIAGKYIQVFFPLSFWNR